MSRIYEIEPIYVEFIPNDLEPGKLYISKRFNLAIHKCACGCDDGRKVVTPFNEPREWKLTEKDGKVTLRPSVGNWMGERPYHAHYYITNNKIEWL